MSQLGVDVIHEDVSNHPHCVHGPTLLFERYTCGKKSGRRFFACSACRDRKDCSFFRWEDEWLRKPQKRQDTVAADDELSHKKVYSRLRKFKRLDASERKFCNDCNRLLLPEECDEHSQHELLQPITDELLQQPSTILKPLVNSKKEAQFLFSKKATKFLWRTLKRLKFEHILCIGCPRVHEYILRKESSMQSLLLDIDKRYEQFYSPAQFCHYNLFNHHFFRGSKGRRTYETFLTNSNVAVVIDPPFGGLVETATRTLHLVREDWKTLANAGEDQLSYLWIFPYFMEQRLKECLPNITMLDYKVEYDNHPLFQGGGVAKPRGSPVRIFTNVNPSCVKLPGDEGYRFCSDCQRYVAQENRHCPECKACTSKDGRQYVHCSLCNACVKPNRTHCRTCNLCLPESHQCGQEVKAGCHICGDLSHKRRQCPTLHVKNASRKRKRC